MIEANVRTANSNLMTVRLSGYDRLTPKAAISAANVAFGSFSHCDVSWTDKGDWERWVEGEAEFVQYRVTGVGEKRRARKVK